MKTRMIITAAAIIFSVTMASANPNKNLTFRDAFGRTLIQPIKVEEASDSVPFDVQAEFIRMRQEAANQVFDLSELMKPEEEEPLPFDLNIIFSTAKK